MVCLSVILALVLASLGAVVPAVAPLSDIGVAHAQDDRAKKDERRVLKADQMDRATVSEQYRQMARQKRHESMNFLKDILANRAPQGTQKAEMMLRLAELYFEENRDIHLDEEAAFQAEFDKCFNTQGCDTDKIKPNKAESRKWADRAIALYRQILQNYPQYQRADEATFFLASALQDIGEREEAVKEFTNLTRTYPESQYNPDAYVNIGEFYFDTNNAYKALIAYQKATRYKESPQYAFATYKLAWCEYNVGEYGKAIETMKSVVAFSMTPAAGADEKTQKSRVMLQDEALKDLVRFYADAGEMDEAYAYFNQLGKKDLIRQMLTRLAGMYFEQGKYEACIQTYRRLIAEDPQGADAPQYQNEIVLAYQKMGKKQETVSEIDRLLKTYGKNSAWARSNSANQDALKAALDYIEKNLRTVAINYHEEAKKLGTGNNAREAYDLAEKAYRVYVQEFPEGKHAYDIRYSFGELLYKLKKYDEAYEQYMKVVALDPNGQYSKFCAESAIFAADEMTKKEVKDGKGPAKPANKTDVIALTEWEQRVLDACDQYAKLYKDDKKTRNVIYKSAYLLYAHNKFKDASDRFRVVIGMDPKSKEAEQAANLILDSFAIIEDYVNLKEVAKAFYGQEGLGSKEFKTEVYNVYERASFKLIEVTFAKDKNERAAAESFVKFYEEFPKSEVADLALNNAGIYFANQGLVKSAMESQLQLVEKFPKSKYFLANIARLGFNYESLASFGESAEWYEKLFNLDKNHEAARDALFSAGVFRRSLGDNDGAIRNYNQFIAAYPDDERTPNLRIEVGNVYRDQKKHVEAAKVYFDFFTKPPANANMDQVFYCRLNYGFALEAQGAQDKADKHFKETLAAFEAAKAKGEVGGATVEFIAQIMFKQAQAEFDRYIAMKVSGPGKKLPRGQTDKILLEQLSGKARALLSVETTYANIVKTGAGEWGLASLVQLGKAYENMSTSLTGSYIPEYLTEDQAELYKMGLEDKAYVQIEKAVNVYSEGLNKSFELNLYNDNTAYATRRLGELRPNDFPVLEEDLVKPRFTARARTTSSFEDQP